MEPQQNTIQEPGVQGQSLVRHAARSGAIIGGIGVVLYLLVYAIDYSLLADWKVGLLMIIVFIGLVIYAGINYRNEAGGYLSYGKAFQHGYVTLLTSALINLVFSLILYTVIDPDLSQNLADAAIEKSGEMMRGFGLSEEQIDQQLDLMRTEMPERYSPMGLVKQFGWNLIIFAVISVITALFVKRNEPEVM